MRLYTDELRRTHFPIIIETNQSREVTREIFSMMHIVPSSFPFIELSGYKSDDIQLELGHFFQKKQMEKLIENYGFHMRDWA